MPFKNVSLYCLINNLFDFLLYCVQCTNCVKKFKYFAGCEIKSIRLILKTEMLICISQRQTYLDLDLDEKIILV